MAASPQRLIATAARWSKKSSLDNMWLTRVRDTALPLLFGTLAFAAFSTNAQTLVNNQQEFFNATRDLDPGDTIVLADGEWRDFEIVLEGIGTERKPITLTAQNKGKVLITGESNLRIAGSHLIVSGLVFTNGHSPTNTVISFRRTKDKLAYHSRITEMVIDSFNNPERHETDFWVMMYGKHNRFDHNYLAGKRNKGVTMAVRLDSEESQENHHRIDHNYFGYRAILGSNGGETLRIGTSKYSLTNSYTVVENNYFDQCNGEVEIVSSKSGGNRFIGNLFYESQGTLTLRHGNDNVIERNVFLGNGVAHTGGIRVINKRQQVRYNYLEGLTGHRFGGGLVIMNGVPDSPINRYHQVEDSVVENNTLVDIDHIELAAGSDAERSAVPISTTFRNNLLFRMDGENDIAVYDDVNGITFKDNIANFPVPTELQNGFQQVALELERNEDGLLVPTDETTVSAGAERSLRVLNKDDTGPSWYPKRAYKVPFDSGASKTLSPEGDTLSATVHSASSGDVLVLKTGEYSVAKTLEIDKTLTIRAEEAAEPLLFFERNAMFEIQDGGNLKLVGLTISGQSSPDMAGNSLIRTRRQSMLSNYELVIEDSTIKDLSTNHSFNVLSLNKHTFADRVEIVNSTIARVTGHVLQMNQEIDDLGIYNVEYITIADSVFEDVDGSVANIYRGGTDESTFGPHFYLKGSMLLDVGNGSRNKTDASVHLHGVQATAISGNHFLNSKPIRVVETVGEPVTRIDDNKYTNTYEPQITAWKRE